MASGALVSLVAGPMSSRARLVSSRSATPVIAALADLVVVVEADVRSGSLTTARAGHRSSGAWSWPTPFQAGCERLLAERAALVESPAEVSAALAGELRVAAPPELDPIAIAVRDAIDGRRSSPSTTIVVATGA